MKRKKAIKLLMSLGYFRNSANVILDEGHKKGSSNENCIYGIWFKRFKEDWYLGNYRFKT